jgi:hypothetical protein
MRDHLAANLLTDPPPHLVFQALLAQNLMSFTEFASRSGHRKTVASGFR